ncbi:putative amidohydrolase [Bradyrhizobium sp. USDA 4011]
MPDVSLEQAADILRRSTDFRVLRRLTGKAAVRRSLCQIVNLEDDSFAGLASRNALLAAVAYATKVISRRRSRQNMDLLAAMLEAPDLTASSADWRTRTGSPIGVWVHWLDSLRPDRDFGPGLAWQLTRDSHNPNYLFDRRSLRKGPKQMPLKGSTYWSEHPKRLKMSDAGWLLEQQQSSHPIEIAGMRRRPAVFRKLAKHSQSLARSRNISLESWLSSIATFSVEDPRIGEWTALEIVRQLVALVEVFPTGRLEILDELHPSNVLIPASWLEERPSGSFTLPLWTWESWRQKVRENNGLNVGVVIQTTVHAANAWKNSLQMAPIEERAVIAQMQHQLAALAQESTPPQIVLLPELTVPVGFLPNLRVIAAQMNAVLIAGMDFDKSRNAKKVRNRAAVVIPNAWGTGKLSSRATVRYVGKTYAAYREQELIKKHGFDFQSVPEVWVFDAGKFGKFAVAVCYDFLDLERVAMYRLGIQHLFILAYNTDIPTFDHAAEALSRMIFCNVVVCNTGTHGGSLAVSPYRGAGKRVIYRHTGSLLATGQTVSLPVADLILAQQNAWPAGRDREFKSLPPGAEGVQQLVPRQTAI